MKKILFSIICIITLTTSSAYSPLTDDYTLGFNLGYYHTKESILSVVASAPDWVHSDPSPAMDCPAGVRGPCTIATTASPLGLSNYVNQSIGSTRAFFQERMNINAYWSAANLGHLQAIADFNMGFLN